MNIWIRRILSAGIVVAAVSIAFPDHTFWQFLIVVTGSQLANFIDPPGASK